MFKKVLTTAMAITIVGGAALFAGKANDKCSIVVPMSASANSGEIGTAGSQYYANAGGVATAGSQYYQNMGAQQTACNKIGTINTHGGVVASYNSSYVVYGGARAEVRKSLGNTWRVKAVSKCVTKGITWYELVDLDDGDYYGWVDSSYIDFYADITPCNLYGQLSTNGGIVEGYTADYVAFNGKKSTVRKDLKNAWHVRAANVCVSKGITWYELVDSDDGDYYGWVDSRYIWFY